MKYNLRYTIFSSNNNQEDDVLDIGNTIIKPGGPTTGHGNVGDELNKNFTVSPYIFMNWFNTFKLNYE